MLGNGSYSGILFHLYARLNWLKYRFWWGGAPSTGVNDFLLGVKIFHDIIPFQYETSLKPRTSEKIQNFTSLYITYTSWGIHKWDIKAERFWLLDSLWHLIGILVRKFVDKEKFGFCKYFQFRSPSNLFRPILTNDFNRIGIVEK